MTSSPASRIARLTGLSVREARVAGAQHGYQHLMLTLAGGRRAFAKVAASDDVSAAFAAEANGLRWLAEAKAVPVPEVLAVGPGALVIAMIPPGQASAGAAFGFGAELARLHASGADAFGAPWPHMLVLARRRKWARGERGAVVTTDGSSMNTRFGGMPKSLRAFLGLAKWAPKVSEANELGRAALAEWYRRSGVRPLRVWHSTSHGSGKGGMLMHYRAVVFEGVGT